jgi:Fe-S-cluster containining protein
MDDSSVILTRYHELLTEVDSWFMHCSLASGPNMACKRGCSACCRGLFDITLLDACLIRVGFNRLSYSLQEDVRNKACQQLSVIQETLWPDFGSPWLLNMYPEEEWELAMPDEDETPCSLLGDDGLCLVYDSRPMTCRLHGAPLIDTSGEILFDEWCSLNFTSVDPMQMPALHWHFNDIFKQEQLLFREFTNRILGKPFNELDTLIPAAVFIDFNNFHLPDSLWIQSSF